MMKARIAALIVSGTLCLYSCNDHKATDNQDNNASNVSENIVVERQSNLHKSVPSEQFDSNYAHIVYFWLNRPNNKEDRQLFEESLRTFLDNSAYAKTQFIGTPPKAIRDVVDDSFTYNLVVTFDSAASQALYQEEAPHKKFVAESSHLWSKVIVYDATSIMEK